MHFIILSELLSSLQGHTVIHMFLPCKQDLCYVAPAGETLNPGEHFDLHLSGLPPSVQIKGKRVVSRASVFGHSLQLHVRKVNLTSGICCICSLPLTPPCGSTTLPKVFFLKRGGNSIFKRSSSHTPLPDCCERGV